MFDFFSMSAGLCWVFFSQYTCKDFHKLLLFLNLKNLIAAVADDIEGLIIGVLGFSEMQLEEVWLYFGLIPLILARCYFCTYRLIVRI